MDHKYQNNRKNSMIQKIGTFAVEKGFYIVLALCAVAIGVSGYVLFFTGNGEDTQPGTDTPVAIVDNPTVGNEDIPTMPQIKVELTEPTTADDAPTVPPRPAVTEPPRTQVAPAVEVGKTQSGTPKFAKPTDGKVQRAFSGDTLVYDDTMADWRVHGGTDFACVEGAKVYAVADGTVTKVFYDEMLGNCVRIKHDGGYESTYCGLVKNATMKEGMSVRRGDVVGGGGGGIIAESAQEVHIHVVLTKDGKAVDLMTLVK